MDAVLLPQERPIIKPIAIRRTTLNHTCPAPQQPAFLTAFEFGFSRRSLPVGRSSRSTPRLLPTWPLRPTSIAPIRLASPA